MARTFEAVEERFLNCFSATFCLFNRKRILTKEFFERDKEEENSFQQNPDFFSENARSQNMRDPLKGLSLTDMLASLLTCRECDDITPRRKIAEQKLALKT